MGFSLNGIKNKITRPFGLIALGLMIATVSYFYTGISWLGIAGVCLTGAGGAWYLFGNK
jgi:hypothetical protein